MICVCGHNFSCHQDGRDKLIIIMPELGKHWCEGCRGSIRSFHTFKQDNLKYLEMEYEKRHSTISL